MPDCIGNSPAVATVFDLDQIRARQSAIIRHMIPDRLFQPPYWQVPYCNACERHMRLIRSITNLGHLPQLDTYHCTPCGKTETIERRLS